ncbi:MAG: aldolase [Ruminococcaceae bacterium]|nr:aldolase [Oscillospiraceae bacterium]
MNKLKERIRRGEKLCGTLVSLTDPSLCELLGYVGFDYIWIDMEHTCISCKDALCHLNAAKSTGTPAIVRVPQDDLTVTKKIVDMGPDGIVFPMIRSYEEAQRIIGTTLYPPLGTRGFGPLRALGYGAVDADEYTAKHNLDMCRFVQIEHIGIIDDLERIVEIPYIDGFIFGPNDLSGSIGEIGKVFDDNTMKLLDKAIKILRAHGKYIGLAGGHSAETIKKWSELDIDMLTAGADWTMLFDKARSVLGEMKKDSGFRR